MGYARSLIADIFRPIMSSRLCASTCIWLGTAPRHSSHNKYNLMSVHFCYLGELYSSMLICLATCQSMLTSLGTFKRVRLKGRISFTQILAQVEGECCLWTVGGWVYSLILCEDEWGPIECWVALIETDACILKAHSNRKSGGSIWASLECQCCFWIAGGWVVT